MRNAYFCILASSRVLSRLMLVSITLVSLSSVLYGCVTTRGRAMQSWQGEKMDRLLQAWGSPDSESLLSDGRKVLTWKEIWSSEGNVHTCRTSFTIAPDGTVESGSYDGCKPLVILY